MNGKLDRKNEPFIYVYFFFFFQTNTVSEVGRKKKKIWVHVYLSTLFIIILDFCLNFLYQNKLFFYDSIIYALFSPNDKINIIHKI